MRALATMQAAVNRAGIGAFDGGLYRFGIFSLIYAQTYARHPNTRPIAVLSLAMSLGLPFETVRRHANALIADGYCVRTTGGVTIAPDAARRADVVAIHGIVHDAFVRFVLDMQHAIPPLPAPTRDYDAMAGVAAGIELILAATDTNRARHGNWVRLAIFSTIVLANSQRYQSHAPLGGVPLAASHAVRPGAVARALNLPEATVRRHVAGMTIAGGPLVRAGRGVIVSGDWLATAGSAETSHRTYQAIRLILARAALDGFPFGDPASAYVAGPPPLPDFT